MNLLAVVCESFQNVNIGGGLRSSFNGWSDSIMAVLTEKIGDNLQKVRNSAEDAFMSCAGHPEFGVQMCLS